MTSIDTNSPGPQGSAAVSTADSTVTPQANNSAQPSAESVSAFEALVAGEDAPATGATTTSESNETTEAGAAEAGATETEVTLDDIREGIRQQVIRDIITKQTTIDI